MGSSQSSKTHVKSPPMELEKMRLGNGSIKEGVARNPSSRGRVGMEEGTRGRSASKSSSVDGDRKKKGGEEDDEMVDGWPKWLVDNIPTDVLKNIVPKSADSYTKIDKV